MPLETLFGMAALYAGRAATNGKVPKSVDEFISLTKAQMVEDKEALQSGLKRFKKEVFEKLIAIDNDYQQFVQTHIDPMLGKTRLKEFQELLGNEVCAPSQEERFANRRIGLGSLALVTAVAGKVLYPPLMAVAIVLGLSTVWTLYYLAYLEWKRTGRVGNLHLTCIYLVFLWLGGYAPVGALGSFLLGIVLKVKAVTENRFHHHLTQVFQLQPTTVWIRSDGIELEIPFDQLQIGDILLLQGGQVVPVDGIIISGAAAVDQHKLTGESEPVEKVVGDTVMMSTILVSGRIDVHVEKTGKDTVAGQIGELLNKSAQYHTTTTLRVFEMSDRFALPTLALSAVSWPFIGAAGAISLLGANSTINTYMSANLAILNFLNIAAECRILVKDGIALERLSQVDTIVFDKTGTLTQEQPRVAQIHPEPGIEADTALQLAAAGEARQAHPIARAILQAASERGLSLPPIDETHYEAGFGIKVRLAKGSLIRVGSGRFMSMEGIALPERTQWLVEECHARGHSVVMVAMDDSLVGCIELEPTIRPEARGIIEDLLARDLRLFIISGDQEAPTRELAGKLGVHGYFADTLPDAKADLVAQLQADGRRVCFIGDGINDAVAMRQADVSISLLGATTAATDTAQIILMEGNLVHLPRLIALSNEFVRNLEKNFNFTAGVSLVAMAGILLRLFTFFGTEILYVISLLGGVGIAMKPLLTDTKAAGAAFAKPPTEAELDDRPDRA